MNKWITAWNQSHTNIQTVTPKYRNRTMWLTVPIGVSCDKIRLRFSNKEGIAKLHIAQVALCINGGERQSVFFGGKEELTLKIGEEDYSDEVMLRVDAGQYVSIFAAFQGEVTSGNCIAAHVQCSKDGNYVFAPQMDISRRSFLDSYWGNLSGIPAISAVEVFSADDPDVIVCLGDSITQQSTWTVPLEQMLNRNGQHSVVVNAGIGGNRLLLGPPTAELQVFGPAAIERFERDVLGVTGVTTVIIAMGTNDIGWIRKQEDLVSAGADAVFSGLKALAQRAHAKQLNVFAATLTPRNGSLDYSPAQENERLRLNEMIRNAHCFDAVIDFATATADTRDAGILSLHYDSGDHLHPSPLGGLKMAKCIFDIMHKESRLRKLPRNK